jgi:hypothetical protein
VALNDTWYWDGTTWTNVSPSPATSTNTPSARFSHAMTYDAAVGLPLMFGGQDESSTNYFADTWEWNGGQ